MVFVDQLTDEKFESLNMRKPCSRYKVKEMTDSGSFAPNGKKKMNLNKPVLIPLQTTKLDYECTRSNC
ncbi:hypothetical protein GQ457_05G026450 [Hibiscus cannabinus]